MSRPRTLACLLAVCLALIFSTCQSTPPAMQVAITPGSQWTQDQRDVVYVDNCAGWLPRRVSASMEGYGASADGLSNLQVFRAVYLAAAEAEGVSAHERLVLITPPRTNRAFTRVWTLEYHSGSATVTHAGSTETVTYSLTVPRDLRLESFEDLGCPAPISQPPSPVGSALPAVTAVLGSLLVVVLAGAISAATVLVLARRRASQ